MRKVQTLSISPEDLANHFLDRIEYYAGKYGSCTRAIRDVICPDVEELDVSKKTDYYRCKSNRSNYSIDVDASYIKDDIRYVEIHLFIDDDNLGRYRCIEYRTISVSQPVFPLRGKTIPAFVKQQSLGNSGIASRARSIISDDQDVYATPRSLREVP